MGQQKQLVGSTVLSEAGVLNVLDYVSKNVPALSVAVTLRHPDGVGFQTTIIQAGNKATTLGLASLAYKMARKRSKAALLLGALSEQDEPEIAAGEDVETYTMEDLLSWCRDESHAIAIGVCVPDDNDTVKTLTYLYGDAAAVRGLADIGAEAASDRCEEAMDGE